jgi:titin
MKNAKEVPVYTINLKQWSLVVIFLSVLAVSASASHFVLADSSTGNDMVVIVDTAIHPSINGVTMGKGDEIGVFDTNGNCYGWARWDSVANSGVTVWGQNTGTGGFGSGEVMRLRVWDSLTNTEMPATATFYPTGTSALGYTPTADSTFLTNGIAILKSLSGLSAPAAPILASPTNGSTNQPTSLTVSWTSSNGASSYAIQVSTVSTFASTIAGQAGISGTSGAVGGLGNAVACYWRANATNAAGSSAWSGIWSFTTIVAIPGAPVLSSPSSGTTGLATPLTVDWAAVTGATTYTAQVSTVSTFTSTVFNQTGLTMTSAATGVLSGGLYYWRANAKNIAGTGVWSNVWHFTTLAVPAAPALSLPANDATNQATIVAVSWTAATGAASYSVQVSTVSTFASMYSNQTGITATSASETGLSYGGSTYYWRVNATNDAGTGIWSGIWSFATLAAPGAPVLAAPTNGAAGQAMTPTLSWATVTTAATYTAQVSTVSTFASTVSSQAGLAANSAAVTRLSGGTVYFWRANAANAAGTGIWSGTWSFTTLAAPAAPVLVSPTNGAAGQTLAPTFTWAASAGAATYEMQLSTVTTFASTVSSQAGLSATSATVGGLAGGVMYYWKANAANTAGTSTWSNIWSFTTLAAPGAPTLVAPTSGAIGQALAPALSWTTVTGAASYGCEVSTVSTFASVFQSQTGLTAAATTTGGLTNSTMYYWKANATNTSGTGVWSAAWSFTTITPSAVVTLSFPANGATNEPTSLTMSWGSATGALSYTLQVSTVSTFASTFSSQAGITGTSRAVTDLAVAAAYYWHVTAITAAGAGVWSSVWSFVTVPAAPVAPTLTSPSNGAQYGTATEPLAWGSVAGATTYSVQVSTVSTFTTTIFSQSGATASGIFNVTSTKTITYYWRVDAANAGGTSAWSAMWKFTFTSGVVLPVVDNAMQSRTVSYSRGMVSYDLKSPARVSIVLFDVSGREARSYRFLQSAGNYRLPLNDPALPSGRYLLRFRAGGLSQDLAITIAR